MCCDNHALWRSAPEPPLPENGRLLPLRHPMSEEVLIDTSGVFPDPSGEVESYRALQDAPLAPAGAVPFRGNVGRGGYILQAFLPADVLTGFDPDQHPRLGIYTVVRDQELGDQYLTVNQDFPFADDPSLWQILELVK